MKKRILTIIIITVLFMTLGCSKSSAIKFKNDYESLNGVVNKNGKEHRTLKIDSNNPYEEVTTDDIIKKIENKETFYVYFGDKLCPWCRSVIEKSIEIANQKQIKKIYYVAIWNDEGEEIVRDKYDIIEGEIQKIKDGDKNYSKLLDIFSSLLSDYTLTNENGEKVNVGEKRIYAPNFIYIENGVPKKLITGISSLQKDSREELTEEILNDEEKKFLEFFNEK